MNEPVMKKAGVSPAAYLILGDEKYGVRPKNKGDLESELKRARVRLAVEAGVDVSAITVEMVPGPVEEDKPPEGRKAVPYERKQRRPWVAPSPDAGYQRVETEVLKPSPTPEAPVVPQKEAALVPAEKKEVKADVKDPSPKTEAKEKVPFKPTPLSEALKKAVAIAAPAK